MIIKRIYPREVNWLERFRGINNAPFRNGDLKTNININWYFSKTIYFLFGMVSHLFTRKSDQRYSSMYGDYLSNKVVRWSSQRKLKTTEPFTGKVGQRHDVIKISDSCPSKLDDSLTLWNLAIAATFFLPYICLKIMLGWLIQNISMGSVCACACVCMCVCVCVCMCVCVGVCVCVPQVFVPASSGTSALLSASLSLTYQNSPKIS